MRHVLSVLLFLSFCSLACAGKQQEIKQEWEALDAKDPETNEKQLYVSKVFKSKYPYWQGHYHWISLTMVINSLSNIDALFLTGGGRKFRCPLKSYCFITLLHETSSVKMQTVASENAESIRILNPDEFLAFFKNKKKVVIIVGYTDGSEIYDLDLSDVDLSMY